MPSWEHFEHQADIGIRGLGGRLEEAFEQAATALVGVITDPDSVRPAQKLTVQCKAQDLEVLLLEWLDAIIYEIATRKMLFSRFQVEIAEDSLKGTVWGEPVNLKRHAPAVEIKGATFTCLKVSRRADGGWVAQCVVDV